MLTPEIISKFFAGISTPDTISDRIEDMLTKNILRGSLNWSPPHSTAAPIKAKPKRK